MPTHPKLLINEKGEGFCSIWQRLLSVEGKKPRERQNPGLSSSSYMEIWGAFAQLLKIIYSTCMLRLQPFSFANYDFIISSVLSYMYSFISKYTAL